MWMLVGGVKELFRSDDVDEGEVILIEAITPCPGGRRHNRTVYLFQKWTVLFTRNRDRGVAHPDLMALFRFQAFQQHHQSRVIETELLQLLRPPGFRQLKIQNALTFRGDFEHSLGL